MPVISIKNQEFEYDESDVIIFNEGLIGLPKMNRAVLIPMPEFTPFCWLASIDDEKNRFIVVNPFEIYADYRPELPGEFVETALETRAIVKVATDWQQTTVNLRAPLFINLQTKKGAQIVLSDSQYELAETLPI